MPRRVHSDPDRGLKPPAERLGAVVATLTGRHGPLEVCKPNDRGSVRLIAHEDGGRSWRLNAQGMLIPESRSEWGAGGKRS